MSTISRANADLMLLLMRNNVNNAEVLNAKTDQGVRSSVTQCHRRVLCAFLEPSSTSDSSHVGVVFRPKADLALLCQKHGIELPLHLAHLPTLPPQRTAEEKAALSAPAWDPMEKTALKDRPPRKTSLTLRNASSSLLRKMGNSGKSLKARLSRDSRSSNSG